MCNIHRVRLTDVEGVFSIARVSSDLLIPMANQKGRGGPSNHAIICRMMIGWQSDIPIAKGYLNPRFFFPFLMVVRTWSVCIFRYRVPLCACVLLLPFDQRRSKSNRNKYLGDEVKPEPCLPPNSRYKSQDQNPRGKAGQSVDGEKKATKICVKRQLSSEHLLA